MRIVYLAAGAAGMYCGSCLHDNTLAAALVERGEDVLLVPTYTPTRTDEPNLSQRRLFCGGINVYLQQKSALFRHTPWFLDRLLDSPRLVGWLASRAAAVRPEQLGDLTVSMLQGELGHQRKEVDKLVHWLATDIRPQIVHLSNSMLLGMARSIMARVPAPVVCTLSGEDIFLEKLVEPFYGQARALLRERAREIHAFVALNRYYADFMAGYLDIPRDQITVVPHGLHLAGLPEPDPPAGSAPPVIGYFARVCPEKGLHNLVEAFRLLAAEGKFPTLRLAAAGYLGAADRPYLDELVAQLDRWGLGDRFTYHGELSREEKYRFLSRLSVCSVPTVYHESKGLSLVEALACGTPIVQPAHGVFPELLADTQGGLLTEPNNPPALAAALGELLTDPGRARALGQAGRARIRERYTADQMAQETLAFYHRLAAR